MSGPGFSALLGWEIRRVGRAPLLWIILAALVASFVWGAVTTATLHRSQTAAQQRILAGQERWLADVKARAGRYAQPPAPGEAELPTWQDPTDLSGFARFFLFVHSIKPHLPLSPLATGNSDLAPSWAPVKVNALFGGEPSYDFENPRTLALGAPGLDFTIVYLLPIGLILLFGLFATFERDHGMLPLIAAQPVSPRLWLFSRIAAVLAWTLPVVLAGIVLALAIAGAALGAAVPALVAALALVAGYMLFWTGLSAAVLAAWPSAAAAIGALTSLWAVLTIGLPLVATLLLSAAAPAPSRTAYVDTQRRVTDAVDAEEDSVVARRLVSDPIFAGSRVAPQDVKDLARLSFTIPEIERRLAPAHSAFGRHRAEQLRVATWAGYAVPPLGTAMALARIAGTDDARQIRFERRTRDFQEQLRDFFYGIARQQVLRPVPFDPAASRGRLNFMRFDAMPRFAVPKGQADTGAAWGLAGWLAMLGTLILGAVGLRLRRWPRRD